MSEIMPIIRIPLYRAIAQKLSHLESLSESFESFQNRFNWTKEHWQEIKDTAEESLNHILGYLPHGSGIDSPFRRSDMLDRNSSSSRKLVFNFGFHHMDENGMYDGWTEHTAIVTPSLQNEFDLRITGRNRNDIKEYMGAVFFQELGVSVDPYEYERQKLAKKERA